MSFIEESAQIWSIPRKEKKRKKKIEDIPKVLKDKNTKFVKVSTKENHCGLDLVGEIERSIQGFQHSTHFFTN